MDGEGTGEEKWRISLIQTEYLESKRTFFLHLASESANRHITPWFELFPQAVLSLINPDYRTSCRPTCASPYRFPPLQGQISFRIWRYRIPSTLDTVISPHIGRLPLSETHVRRLTLLHLKGKQWLPYSSPVSVSKGKLPYLIDHLRISHLSLHWLHERRIGSLSESRIDSMSFLSSLPSFPPSLNQ